MTTPSFITKERYWDLSDVSKTSESYSDFESLLSKEDVERITEIVNTVVDSKTTVFNAEFVRDILTHFLVESVSEAGWWPPAEEINTFVSTIDWVFSSRWWLKRNVV